MSHPAPSSGDWTVQAADTVERVVTTIRDKTTVPLTTVARALVFGLLAAILGVTALVLLSVTVVRVLDVYLPGPVYWAHLVAGMIFTLPGLVLLRKATASSKR